MDKNEILAKAQANAIRGSEYENHIFKRSGILTLLLTVILGMVLAVVQYVVKHSFNVELYTTITFALGFQALYEGVRTKKVIEIIIGVIVLCMTALLLLTFLTEVLA